MGESLVQMISLKSELHMTVNEKVSLLEGEVRKKLGENANNLQAMKSELLNAS